MGNVQSDQIFTLLVDFKYNQGNKGLNVDCMRICVGFCTCKHFSASAHNVLDIALPV